MPSKEPRASGGSFAGPRPRLRKAVIPAAGLGTRFLPATKAIAKELLPVVDRPIIQYIVEEAAAAGIVDIIFVTSTGKDAILDHFDFDGLLESELKKRGRLELLDVVRRISKLAAHIIAVRQKEPLGLGHAVLQAAEAVGNEPFAVMLGDDLVDSEVPCIQQMMAIYEKTGAGVVAVQAVPRDQVERYGVIKARRVDKRTYLVDQLVEKPTKNEAPSNLAIVGRYILPPDIFPILENTSPGRGGEIQLTDALQQLTRTQAFYACQFEGTRYDAGDKLGFLQANLVYALKDPSLARALRAFLREIA